MRQWKIGFLITLLFGYFASTSALSIEDQDVTPAVELYIHNTWSKLTRTNQEIVSLYLDKKVSTPKPIVYIDTNEDIKKIRNKFSDNSGSNITIAYLPKNAEDIKDHGLLYLPHSYVVPGGRFNEMYGWDSYFIELGLLADGKMDLAKNMVDNLLYEVDHYGTVLNANRSYYLGRSQPPLLSEMVLAYYSKAQDKKWLQSTLPELEKLYSYWTQPPRYIPEIGLSRYYGAGQGATPEEAPIYYEKARNYFKTHTVRDYDKSLYYDEKTDSLTSLFYVADRAVRESGFDITAKYGPFGASILDYAPVDLNVLLYQLEKDISDIYQIVGNSNKATMWNKRAIIRANLINQYMWNDGLGYYFDYNVRGHYQRPYIYATTFYPLWAGIASKAQAEQVAANLPNLLSKGGVVSSLYASHVQWDAPFGWAPMQYFAVFGLDRYGYKEQAKEVATRFVDTVNTVFNKTHQLYEKYNVQEPSLIDKNKVDYGYNTNEIGFGWTNGVYLALINYLNTAKKH